jgi:hypothetical protein
MKFSRFNRIIRMQLVLMGMGTAMLFASPARAQQDVDPTSFEVTPGVPPAQQAHQVEGQETCKQPNGARLVRHPA